MDENTKKEWLSWIRRALNKIDDVKEALNYSKEIVNFIFDIYIKNLEYSGEKL